MHCIFVFNNNLLCTLKILAYLILTTILRYRHYYPEITNAVTEIHRNYKTYQSHGSSDRANIQIHSLLPKFMLYLLFYAERKKEWKNEWVVRNIGNLLEALLAKRDGPVYHFKYLYIIDEEAEAQRHSATFQNVLSKRC